MKTRFRIALAFLLLCCVLLSLGAQIRLETFSLVDFDYLVEFALDRYIDPENIDVSRAYVGAAETALASLPYQLKIYPRSFFERREEIQTPERIVPGNVIVRPSSDSFVILEPDYAKWDEITAAYQDRYEELRQSMSDEERRSEVARLRQQRELEKSALEAAWERTAFGRAEFLSVIGWIERNLYRYMSTPAARSEERPVQDGQFGMHDVFFNAANGFVSTFDPHSNVQKVETWEQIRSESEDSSYEGIGAVLRGGGTEDVIVETPLADSPALESGLRAGDIIRKVNGESIEGLGLNMVVDRILGPRGTRVQLQIERPPLMEIKDISITRGLIEQKAVSHRYLPDKRVGVITISSFLYGDNGSETSTLVMDAYFDLMEESSNRMDALVLDLRNNGGGFLLEAVGVAGLFLDANTVVVQRTTYNGSMKPYRNPFYPIDEEIPLAVLINAVSASASEIVASALMDYNRALILGDRSFGKATIQEVHPLGDVMVKVTTGRYYSPLGYTLQIAGVTPDISVSDEEDGGFRDSYREEDMWRSLPQLELRSEDPMRQRWVEKLEDVVGNGEAYLNQRLGEALRPDYMLYRAMPYVDALKRYPSALMVLPEPVPID